MNTNCTIFANMSYRKSEVIKLELWCRIVGFIISALMITFNSIELHVLRRTVNRPFYENFLMSLSLNDLICGVFVSVSVTFLSIVKNELYIVIHWNVWGFGLCYVTLISLMHIVIISIDRLWAIKAPLHHRKNSTNRKLIVAVALSWSIPMIFVVVFICIVLFQRMDAKEIYWFVCIMCMVVSVVVVMADIILLVCYSAIIWVIKRQRSDIRLNTHSKKKLSMNVLVLCVGLVSVFVFFTTPFVAVFITDWNSPHWLMKVVVIMYPFNQICNSIIYLVHRIRRNRLNNNKGDGKDQLLQMRLHQKKAVQENTGKNQMLQE